MTTNTFVLVYRDDWRGRRKARRALNKWYIQRLFCKRVWYAWYDAIQGYHGATGGIVVKWALVRSDDPVEV